MTTPMTQHKFVDLFSILKILKVELQSSLQLQKLSLCRTIILYRAKCSSLSPNNQNRSIIVSAFCIRNLPNSKKPTQKQLIYLLYCIPYQIIHLARKSLNTPSFFESLLKPKDPPRSFLLLFTMSHPKKSNLALKTLHEYIRKRMKTQEL